MIDVTVFRDVQARAATAYQWTIDELAQRLREPSVYASKAECPLLKLARFGDQRSDKGSLRHDANLLEITGIEGDHDSGTAQLHDVQIMLYENNVESILYTSPSHTPEKPRWRVLCPLSKPYPPAERARFVARLNGVLGGILAPESFTLSQAFYVGRVNGSLYESVQVRGTPIDLLPELDAKAVYPEKRQGEARAERHEKTRCTDPVIARLTERGLVLRQRSDGGIDIICPFEAEHTTPRAAGDCVYWPAHTGGFQRGHFKCLHSHCAKRGDDDYLRAIGIEKVQEVDEIRAEDFYAYMPMHQYLFVPSRELWPGSSVNARVPPIPGPDGKPIKASKWLDGNRAVEQMTWAPGEPMLIKDRLIANGGWIDREGCSCFNLYMPPVVVPGDPLQVDRWLEHCTRLFGEDSEHIIRWLAHRVQRPGEKINHALVLGGLQGIGKDTLLEPVKYAVGPWNFSEVSPAHLLGRFNGFVKSVILRVSEARDLGDVDRYSFYDHMKVYTAAPPDVLRCDEKHIREHAVLNAFTVVITSNHKADGIYLPADDRRHFVAWSDLSRESFAPDYWTGLYRWFWAGGNANVAAYLAGIDLSDFDPKAPPRKTSAFWDIVDANRAPEDAELADVIEGIGTPPAITIARLVDRASSGFHEWLLDRRNRRQIPHRLEAAGYAPVRNPYATDGLWKIQGKRQVVYTKVSMAARDRLAAAQELTR